MKNNKIHILGFALFFSIFLFSCNSPGMIKVKRGVVDINGININKEKVKLNGEWEFYYGQLLTPADFRKKRNLKKTYISVPGSWSNQKKHKNYPEYGYATYRVNIIAGDTINPIMIESKRIFTACKIWWNGELIKEIGKVGKRRDEYSPELRLFVSKSLTLKSKNELIIQVANFSDRYGGILNSVRISNYNSFAHSNIIELIFIVAALSIILIAGLYHFVMFLLIKTDYSYLIFSILAFSFILAGISGSDTLLKNIISPGFIHITRVFHSIVSLYPGFICLFFYILFKKEVSKIVLTVSLILSVVFLIFSFLLPVHIVREYVVSKIIFILFISGYFVFYSLPLAMIRKRQGALWAFIGMSLLFLSNINDILFSSDILRTEYYSMYGFFGFVLFQSMNIAERFSSSFKRNVKLSFELKEQNSEYIALNENYKKQNQELEKAKNKAENADMLKSAFLANMSHEIRTPMNAILGFSDMLKAEKIDDKKRIKLIDYIIRSGNTLLKLINDIIDISKIEAGQLEISRNKCVINNLFEELKTIYSESNTINIPAEITLTFNSDPISETEIITDYIRLKQVLINLIDNALKFTEKGVIEVSYEFNEELPVFCVKDSGIGLTREQKEMIFSRFTKMENEGDKLYRGAGLGLSICKNIIELLGGKIWVESEPDKGAAFYFTISAE